MNKSAPSSLARLQNLHRLPAKRKLLLLPALTSLIFSRILFSIVSFEKFSLLVRRIPQVSKFQSDTLVALRWAVVAASRSLGLFDSCLYRCAAFAILCKIGGYEVVLKLGVKDSNNFEAHAWLENSNGQIILEELEEQELLAPLC